MVRHWAPGKRPPIPSPGPLSHGSREAFVYFVSLLATIRTRRLRQPICDRYHSPPTTMAYRKLAAKDWDEYLEEVRTLYIDNRFPLKGPGGLIQHFRDAPQRSVSQPGTKAASSSLQAKFWSPLSFVCHSSAPSCPSPTPRWTLRTLLTRRRPRRKVTLSVSSSLCTSSPPTPPLGQTSEPASKSFTRVHSPAL